jgi:propanediol dehydratase small subunit
MNQELLEKTIREMLKEANGSSPTPTSTHRGTVGVADYPLGAKRPDLVKTVNNKSLDDITLENVLNGSITPEDVRVTAETLKLQADVARAAGRGTLANNFERAAELTVVPDERVLQIYNALRPFRSSKEELLDIANELENKYNAVICASFVREAAALYQERKKLKGDN